MSRWYATAGETGRLISLAVATLRDRGVEEPRDHIVLAAQGRVATLVLSKDPLSAEALAAVESVSDRLEHTILMSPNTEPASDVLRAILQADANAGREVWFDQFFDLTPPTDDRPFFFNQLPLSRPVQALRFARQWIGSSAALGGVRAGNLVATATLIILFVIALTLVMVTIVIPLRSGLKDVGGRLVAGGTSYFLLIGIGFMMIEIGLLQRMSVFLGHPIYSLAIVLFSLILSTGLGSITSDRLPLDSRTKFVAWATATAVSVWVLLTWLPPVLLRYDSGSLALRCLICVLALVPVGLLMGFGFPTGMRLVEMVDRRPTPWFWGINGAAGVLASIVAIAVSIAYGISVTLAIGALCYLALIPVALRLMWPDNDETNHEASLSAVAPTAPAPTPPTT